MRLVSTLIGVMLSALLVITSSVGIARAQSDEQSDDQFCAAVARRGPSDAGEARVMGNACASAAETRRRAAAAATTARKRQEQLMYAAAYFVDAAKARMSVGMRLTALAEIRYAQESLNEVLAKPANPGLRRSARTLLQYAESMRVAIEETRR